MYNSNTAACFILYPFFNHGNNVGCFIHYVLYTLYATYTLYVNKRVLNVLYA